MSENASSGYLGWNKTQHILLLCGGKSNADLGSIFKLKEALEKEGKTINLITFVDAKKPKENVLSNTWYTSDIGFVGLPKKHVNQMLTSNCDVVINWTDADKSGNDFLVLKSGAKFKIGVNKSDSYFDLLIKDDSQHKNSVIEEILKYLKLINNE